MPGGGEVEDKINVLKSVLELAGVCSHRGSGSETEKSKAGLRSGEVGWGGGGWP